MPFPVDPSDPAVRAQIADLEQRLRTALGEFLVDFAAIESSLVAQGAQASHVG
jgi:hypothetical protein